MCEYHEHPTCICEGDCNRQCRQMGICSCNPEPGDHEDYQVMIFGRDLIIVCPRMECTWQNHVIPFSGVRSIGIGEIHDRAAEHERDHAQGKF